MHRLLCSVYTKVIILLAVIVLIFSNFRCVSTLCLQYALIDSKKSYVRYISHELRTPLNSAFLGICKL